MVENSRAVLGDVLVRSASFFGVYAISTKEMYRVLWNIFGEFVIFDPDFPIAYLREGRTCPAGKCILNRILALKNEKNPASRMRSLPKTDIITNTR